MTPEDRTAHLDLKSLRALLDALVCPAALIDDDTDRVLHANDPMTQLLGASVAERPSSESFADDPSTWNRRPLSGALHLVQLVAEAPPPQTAFVAMLGHELRNPLAPIRHATEMLSNDPAATRKAREIIERQVAHMTRLVNDLLDAGQATRGRLPIKREPMRLSDAVEAASESCERLFARRGHHLRIDTDSIATIELEGDLVRLTQVVSNLLSNAAKYTPQGGRVSLTARVEGPEAILEVRDNGRGFTQATASRFFDPFTQAAQPIDRTTGGLGLGLPLVRYIVQEHGGSVDGTSDGPGTGATFTVRLPDVRRGVSERPESREPQQDTPTIDRILVVDDNEDAAQMMSLILQSRGFECVVAYDGESALEEMKTSKFPLALVDIGLPGLDGYEVATRAASLSTRPTHLVALSGYGQRSDIERAMEAGFDAYRVKPISIEELDALLKS